jgi:hypothetical protein
MHLAAQPLYSVGVGVWLLQERLQVSDYLLAQMIGSPQQPCSVSRHRL